MRVNIYMYQTIKGGIKRQGYGIFVLDAEMKEAYTKTLRIRFEKASENEAELKTFCTALSRITIPCEIYLYTESEWLSTCLKEWLPKWRAHEYLSAKNEKVAFSGIWQKLGSELETQNLCVVCGSEHPYREWLKKNAKPA